MTTPIVNQTIPQGSDGKTPIYNPEAKWQIHALHELWDGTVGEKRYVPNVGDMVIDVHRTSSSKHWIVKALNIDLIPTLIPWGSEPSQTLDLSDILTAPGNSTHNATYRAYVDKSVMPYTLAVDARLSYKGTAARYVKIFRGAVTEGLLDSGRTRVISGYYDNLGNLTTDSVALERVGPAVTIEQTDQDPVTAHASERAEFAIPVSYTKEDLPDNEILTIVAYSAAGHLVSKTQVLVENTSFTRARNSSRKLVTGISLITPFMSDTNNRLILLPINIPLQGLHLKGRVHYSDGSSRDYPVDGVKFTLLGMESYLATMVNQRLPVILRYRPSQNEQVESGTPGDVTFMTQQYDIRTIEANGAYYVKLFCYPEWQGPLNGYRLRWWMYTGERNTFYDVTQHVRHAVNTNGFNPTAYGVSQILNVSVNLRDVNPLFEDYRHAQTVTVILWRQGTERNDNWSVLFDPNQDPAYGVGTYARLQFINYNYWKINLHSGCSNQREWLDKLYYNAKPFIDPARESVALAPTHFRLLVGENDTITLPISEWNKTQSILNGLQVNETVYLQWIHKTPATDLELGVSGLPIWDNAGVDLPDVMLNDTAA